MVDEAHGAGVLGARGAGASELLGVEDRVDLRMGTFSKSLASCGGFIAGSHEVIDYLRIQSRAFLFTASAVPAAVGAALAALRVMPLARGPAAVRARARERAHPRGRAARARLPRASGTCTRRPIVPVLVEDDWKCVLLWRALYDAGVFVNTALHPAVPPGGALLRTSVMATHDRATLDRALAAFGEVKAALRGRARTAARPRRRLASELGRRSRVALDRRAQPFPDERADDPEPLDDHARARCSGGRSPRCRARQRSAPACRGPGRTRPDHRRAAPAARPRRTRSRRPPAATPTTGSPR